MRGLCAAWFSAAGLACVLPEAQLASETELCLACAEQRCPADYGACSGNFPCRQVLACSAGCATSDAACLTACADANPEGAPLAGDLFACAGSSCPDDCAGLGG